MLYAAGDGVHWALPAARVAQRLREGALLWAVPCGQPAPAGAGPRGACWTSPTLPDLRTRHRDGSGSRQASRPARGAVPVVWRADGADAAGTADESRSTAGSRLRVTAEERKPLWY